VFGFTWPYPFSILVWRCNAFMYLSQVFYLVPLNYPLEISITQTKTHHFHHYQRLSPLLLSFQPDIGLGSFLAPSLHLFSILQPKHFDLYVCIVLQSINFFKNGSATFMPSIQFNSIQANSIHPGKKAYTYEQFFYSHIHRHQHWWCSAYFTVSPKVDELFYF